MTIADRAHACILSVGRSGWCEYLVPLQGSKQPQWISDHSHKMTDHLCLIVVNAPGAANRLHLPTAANRCRGRLCMRVTVRLVVESAVRQEPLFLCVWL
jgi:hypothetical protein